MSDPARSAFFRGLVYMAIAMALLPFMDAIAKHFGSNGIISPGQVAFYRFFFQLLTTLPLLLTVAGAGAFRARRPWMNMLRGTLHAAATILFFVAVKYMPLADVFAIYFVEPFMLVGLSALFLGERVDWQRWAAIAAGFVGALIVIRPSWEIFGPAALLPVFCAFIFALYLFLNRWIGDGDPPLTMQSLAGVGGMLLSGAVLMVGHALGSEDFEPALPPDMISLGLLVALGALSGYGHLLVVKAFRLAPISVLAPFQYFEIISATILGYLYFSEFPDAMKWLGISIIVISGLVVIWRGRVVERREFASAGHE